MTDSFGRQAMVRINEMKRAAGALVGIVTGMLADGHLSDQEILFLREWLENNTILETSWPGNVLAERVEAILADGSITEEERASLTQTLQDVVGGAPEDLSDSLHVTNLLDEVERIEFQGAEFCLTGDFVMGRKAVCEKAITDRGGHVRGSVSKKLRYVIAGGLGSKEWKHGSFGTKIERAMQLKQEGAAILIVHEEVLARSLQAS